MNIHKSDLCNSKISHAWLDMSPRFGSPQWDPRYEFPSSDPLSWDPNLVVAGGFARNLLAPTVSPNTTMAQ
jgi:hypothetical protein